MMFFQFFRSIDLLPKCSWCLAAVIFRTTLLTFSLALWSTENGHQHLWPPRIIQAGKVKQTTEKNWFLHQMGRKNCCWETILISSNRNWMPIAELDAWSHQLALFYVSVLFLKGSTLNLLLCLTIIESCFIICDSLSFILPISLYGNILSHRCCHLPVYS